MGTTRSGFTLIEMMTAITVMGTAAAMAFPQVAVTVSHARVNQAATVAAGEFEMASSLADRQRKPVRITVDPSYKTIVIADRSTGAILSEKKYGLVSEYRLSRLIGVPAQIDIFPNGTVSGSLRLTMQIDNYVRHVTMTRAGQVRVTP